MPLLPTPPAVPARHGRAVFLQAYPEQGRRVAIDVGQDQIWDLSQPDWDAHFSLSQDGRELALTNGRSGLWPAPVVYP
jgi:hypothetical protein